MHLDEFKAAVRRLCDEVRVIASPGETLGAFSRATAHVLRPSRLLFLDNTQGIGRRLRLDLVDGRPVGAPRPQARG